ncbi:hypothetical protein EHS25_009305 [Saitozyma podzolica]|uniref:DUF899 domain-containing protein n=1 Tax=Saitozyma podzolica TaxID=1890683 RepID=A0A427YLG3_9TREE|nr:hypothetical protein EHS25_009305 [Saitozyma podzolica]
MPSAAPLDAPKPKIVSAEEYAKARDELLKAEKEATRLLDRVAAQRRRLPMVQFDSSCNFKGPEGDKTLLELFGDDTQLALYQFMDLGPGKICPGCEHMGDSIPEFALKQLHDRGISFVFASNMPLEQIEECKKEHGWKMPFYSSRGTKFTDDCGCKYFMLSMFVRDANGNVYRTYSTTQRGVDRIVFSNNIEDLAVYGRQEEWEDSPEGWPQHPTYG